MTVNHGPAHRLVFSILNYIRADLHLFMVAQYIEGLLAFPEAQYHGVRFSERKKKFAQPLILILSTKKDIEVNALQFCKCLRNTYAQS